jgi:hypothetical protein
MIDTILVLVLIGVLLGVIELLVRTSLVVAPRIYAKGMSYLKQVPLLLMATTIGAIAVTIVSFLVLFVAPIPPAKEKKTSPAPAAAPPAVPTAKAPASTLRSIPFPAFAWAKDIPTALPFPNPWKASRVSRAAVPSRAAGAGPTKQA